MLTFKPFYLFACVIIAVTLSACGGGGGGGDDGGGDDSGGGSSEFYRVTVTVSGLGSDTVTVSNNNIEPFFTRGEGDFVIDNLPAGTGYDVRIVENPRYKLCRIINGSVANLSSDQNASVICEEVLVAAACSGEANSDDDDLTDCQELNVFGTDPWDSDTDGDGRDDSLEATDFNPANSLIANNPRIADLAKFAVDLQSPPTILIDFEDSVGNAVEVSTDHGTSVGNEVSSDLGGETSRQLELGHTISSSQTTTVGVEVEASLTGPSATASLETSLTSGFSQSSTQSAGSSINWNTQQRTNNTDTYNESVAASETAGTTFNGGTLSVVATIRNTGQVAYDLTGLTLNAVFSDPRNPYAVSSIGTLIYDDVVPFFVTLGSGATAANFNFKITDLNLQLAQELLRNSRGVVITPGASQLLDVGSASILLKEEGVKDNTATVAIDFGVAGNGENKYRVAIDNGDGTQSISAMEALSEILGLAVTQGPGQWVYTDAAAATATPVGLLEVSGTTLDNINNRYWLVAHNHRVDLLSSSRVTDTYNLLLEAYDLNNIRLRADDNLTLVYVGDQDRDGVSDFNERLLGTLEDNPDSDGDTLGDAVELYGWLTNFTAPPCEVGADPANLVFSDPLEADSDGDGINDAVEKNQLCSNPFVDFDITAGPDQLVNRNQAGIQLSASITRGTTGGAVSYIWTLESGPDVNGPTGPTTTGPTRTLEGIDPVFTAPDEVSSLLFKLSVSDTQAGTPATDQVLVQVVENTTKAAFVGSARTSTAALGSMENPYTSITQALGTGDDLYIENTGTDWQITNTLPIGNGQSMFGGYRAITVGSDVVDWVRDVSVSPTPLTRSTSLDMEPVVEITQASQEMWFSGFDVTSENSGTDPDNHIVAMRVALVTEQSGPLHITDNVITADDVAGGTSATPGSSYALMVMNVGDLEISNNTLNAGTGGAGASGTAGTPGTDGAAPANPDAGGEGGAGGGGGACDLCSGSGTGAVGQPGQVKLGAGANEVGDGAAGGTSGGSNSGTGGTGAGGVDGSAVGGHLELSEWSSMLPGDRYNANLGDGTDGGVGQAGGGGGGGGGGAGGFTTFGGNGGAGGQGGAGSSGGTRGTGGGASIGLWLGRGLSPDGTSLAITGNIINTSTGGFGGANNWPGFTRLTNPDGVLLGLFVGSNGANGAPGRSNASTGGSGGQGGFGGIGGYSGAGAGGPSIGILVGSGIVPRLSGNEIASGNGGNSGALAPRIFQCFAFLFGCILSDDVPIQGAVGGDGGDSYAIFDVDPTVSIPDIVNQDINLLTPGLGGSSSGTAFGGSAGVSAKTNF